MTMKKDRRWLKSVIAAAAEPQVALPFTRGNRRPLALRLADSPAPAPQAAAKPRALAAR